ncbi:MAG: ATP-binding protein, partial [Elusimicrobia bacterium]|nr:ATP-binding protein [Elusimicrobiota bacterium]
MTETFWGREKELLALRRACEAGGSQFLPIYGRRRVGKSELILQFIKSAPAAVYFLGKKAPPELQIREFLEVAAQTLGEPLLASFQAGGWKAALEAVVSRWKGPGKLVLSMDEFQWTVEASPELPSILQELWDRRWRKSGNVFLILCGSYVGFMEREVLGEKSPLFGRRTGQIFLKPFGHQEAALFHPRLSPSQKAMTYFITGGIPLYLKLFSQELSVEQNIQRTILDEFAPLFREPDFLLREELREVEKYYAVLMALSEGALPSRDIARRTGIGDRSLHYYLQNLVELGYLGRRYPVADIPRAARHIRYEVTDPLLRFWFRFVYPQTSSLLRLGPVRALDTLVRPHLPAYFGRCFEGLCREALPSLYEKEGVSASFEVGEYWDKNVQVDVVGLRQDGWVDLGECKWGNRGSPASAVAELKAKVPLYPNRT